MSLKCIVDGKRIRNKRALHLLLKKDLKLSDYYGNNLDALWDEISSSIREREIIVKNQEDLIENLGEYGKRFMTVLYDLDKSISNFVFIIEKGRGF
ncbi:barstar family protein [Gallicola sp. Sow4_E12]|uniref:barstar family protein n=1 Tax=Gallicola sp. Sow4_E12 TaxID=3438785 RepID=UPI003F928C1B